VRIFVSLLRAPIGRFLQVIDLIGSEVTPLRAFAVRIGDIPMLAGERLAVFVQQIELGHSGIVLAILCIQCFEAEIAALDSLAELHFLPAVSGFQRTVGNRFLTFQVQRLPLFTVGSRGFSPQHIQDRFLPAFHYSLFRA